MYVSGGHKTLHITRAEHHAKHSKRQFLPKWTCLRKKKQFYEAMGEFGKSSKRCVAELVTESSESLRLLPLGTNANAI